MSLALLLDCGLEKAPLLALLYDPFSSGVIPAKYVGVVKIPLVLRRDFCCVSRLLADELFSIRQKLLLCCHELGQFQNLGMNAPAACPDCFPLFGK
jgi:hypothetical protein